MCVCVCVCVCVVSLSCFKNRDIINLQEGTFWSWLQLPSQSSRSKKQNWRKRDRSVCTHATQSTLIGKCAGTLAVRDERVAMTLSAEPYAWAIAFSDKSGVLV